MEHRWNPRKEINSPVMIYQERTGIIKATVINFSADGMLVDMGRFALTKGAAVALAGATFRRLQSEMFRLRALIIHSNDNLAGLMFIGDRHNVSALWRDLENNNYDEAYFPTGQMNGTHDTAILPRAVAYASR